jgi:hypothetical protein
MTLYNSCLLDLFVVLHVVGNSLTKTNPLFPHGFLHIFTNYKYLFWRRRRKQSYEQKLILSTDEGTVPTADKHQNSLYYTHTHTNLITI